MSRGYSLYGKPYFDSHKKRRAEISTRLKLLCSSVVFHNSYLRNQFTDLFDDRIQFCDYLIVKENLAAMFTLPTGDIFNDDHAFF